MNEKEPFTSNFVRDEYSKEFLLEIESNDAGESLFRRGDGQYYLFTKLPDSHKFKIKELTDEKAADWLGEGGRDLYYFYQDDDE